MNRKRNPNTKYYPALNEHRQSIDLSLQYRAGYFFRLIHFHLLPLLSILVHDQLTASISCYWKCSAKVDLILKVLEG